MRPENELLPFGHSQFCLSLTSVPRDGFNGFSFPAVPSTILSVLSLLSVGLSPPSMECRQAYVLHEPTLSSSCIQRLPLRIHSPLYTPDTAHSSCIRDGLPQNRDNLKEKRGNSSSFLFIHQGLVSPCIQVGLPTLPFTGWLDGSTVYTRDCPLCLH